MPRRVFKRKGFRKKGFRKGKPWYAKKYSAMDAGRYALSQIWKLKGLINSEMHKLDSNSGATSVINTGVVDAMCKVAVGDTYADRTGNSIYVRSLNIRGLANIGTSESVNAIRMAIVQDTQQIADTTPTWSDVYDSNDVRAHLNPATVGRFKVLADKMILLNSVSKPQIEFKFNLPMRHHVRYNGSATTDIQKGALYVVYIGAYTTNAPSVNYRARLSFHDN